MTTWHGYLIVSELPPGWTQEQRQTAWAALHGLGRQSGPEPAKINQTRLSRDGRALVVEAEFDESEITRAAVVATIAGALGVNPVAVNARIDYEVFAEGGTWEESRLAAVAYLREHADDWEETGD